MTVGKSDDAEDMISIDDFMGFLKEKPRTKLDVLTCVGSFALERFEKRQHLAPKKKKLKQVAVLADDHPLSPRSVLNCFLVETPKKKRSKRPRLGCEFNLNLKPPVKKLKEETVTTSDLGVGSDELKKAINVPIIPSSKDDSFLSKAVSVGLRDQIERLNGLFVEKSLPGSIDQKTGTRPPDHQVPFSLEKPKKKTIKHRKRCPNITDVLVSRDVSVCLRDQIDRMNGSDMLLLVEKPLTDSDVNSILSRLMMPEGQMINEFLTEEEYAYLKIKVGKNVNGLDVYLIEPSVQGGCSKITLRRWEMKKQNGTASVAYVLTSGWNCVVSRNQLKSGDIVQVWSFRVDQKLHLALVLL